MHILYPIIIILGILTSYTDIKFGIIRNKHLLFSIIIGFAAYSYLLIIQHYSFSNRDGWILDLLVGIGITLLLYFTNVWSAGDAKLFAVFCFLMPTKEYSNIFPFASVALFFNIFILGTLVLLFSSAIRIVLSRTRIFHEIFSIESLRNFGDSFYVIVCLNWISPFIIHRLIPEIPRPIYFLILYSSYHAINFVLKEYVTSHIIACSIYGLGFLTRIYVQPLDLIGVNILHNIKITLFYTFSFHGLYTIFVSDNGHKGNLPFAPVIFAGTLLANTNFLNSVMNLLIILRQ